MRIRFHVAGLERRRARRPLAVDRAAVIPVRGCVAFNISSAAVGSTYSLTNLVKRVSRTGRRRPSTIRQDDIDPAE